MNRRVLAILLALAALCVAALAAPWLQGAATIAAALALRPTPAAPEPARPDGRLDYPAMLAYAMHLASAPQPVRVLDYDALMIDEDARLLARLLAEGVS